MGPEGGDGPTRTVATAPATVGPVLGAGLAPPGVRCQVLHHGQDSRAPVHDMLDEEIDHMMNTVSQIFSLEHHVGKRYGIKAAVRAERRCLDDEDSLHNGFLLSGDTTNISLDALSQEGLSAEAHPEKEAAGSGGGGTWVATSGGGERSKKQQQSRWRKGQIRRKVVTLDQSEEEMEEHCEERQREHPFIVTEPQEVARGKKNGLDYLFHLLSL